MRGKHKALPYDEFQIYSDTFVDNVSGVSVESKRLKHERWGAALRTGALAVASLVFVSYVGYSALDQARPLDHWVQDLIGMDE